MLLHEFGSNNKKTIVMLHGLAMSWDMLKNAIDGLAVDYHVFAVAVPGMDLEEKNEFTSVEEIAAEIEDALIAKGIRSVCCLYGLSMGGGIALRMLADNRLPFDTAIIDAGITPYELPRIVTRLVLVGDVSSTLLGKASKCLLEMAFPPEKYTQAAVDRMGEVLHHMTLKTIWRAYDSTDNYSMPQCFPTIDTRIAYWYGEDEKKARKLDIQYVQKHVPGIRLRQLPGMDHGQYIIAHPAQFVADVKTEMERG